MVDEYDTDNLAVLSVMCENASYELPSTQDAADWLALTDVSFPALADAQGEVCATYAFVPGFTTLYVLDTGLTVNGRHDSSDPAVLDTVRASVDGLLQ